MEFERAWSFLRIPLPPVALQEKGESERLSASHQSLPLVSHLKALLTANCRDTTEAPQPATMPLPQNPSRMAALDDTPFISSQTTISPELVSDGPSLHHGYDLT